MAVVMLRLVETTVSKESSGAKKRLKNFEAGILRRTSTQVPPALANASLGQVGCSLSC